MIFTLVKPLLSFKICLKAFKKLVSNAGIKPNTPSRIFVKSVTSAAGLPFSFIGMIISLNFLYTINILLIFSSV